MNLHKTFSWKNYENSHKQNIEISVTLNNLMK